MPEQYKGWAIAESGRVAHYEVADGVTVLLMVTNEERGDVVIAAFDPSVFDEPIFEGDTIYCYGTFRGLYDLSTVSGRTISVPYMFCDHVELG